MRWSLLALVLLSACVTSRSGARPGQRALPPATTGPLAALDAKVVARGTPGQSGFKLLEVNEDALRWRLRLIDAAQHSLDLMTFLWWGDDAGDLVLQHVLAAADRGVRVRLIVDDMSNVDDAAHRVPRDVSNAAIDAHPNVELRVFNAWGNRGSVGRAVEFVGDFERLNQRMHNKALIADGHAALMGGRNLGNEYMGLSTDFNFRDLDVLVVGPASAQVSSVFDRYWNSGWVKPQRDIGVASQPELAAHRQTLAAQLSAAPHLERFPRAVEDVSAALDALVPSLHLGTSRVVTDSPDDDKVTHVLPALVREVWAGARREVLVTNAYIIPDEQAFERTRTELQKDVRFVMLTNSLASTDAAGVHAHYTEWRPRMVANGVELYELRHDAAVRRQVVDTAPVQAGFVGLHAKAMVIDRAKVIIGSMNLDPRSWVHNSEMVMVIDSEELGRELAEVIERDLRPENAWRVELDAAGAVRWVSGAEVRHEPPAREEAQRLEETLHRLLPADLY